MTILSVLTNTTLSAFGLLVWARTSVLQGNPGDCPAKFIVLGYSVSVTSKVLRGFSLLVFASGIVIGFITALFNFIYYQIVKDFHVGKYQTHGYVWDIKSDSVTSPGKLGFLIPAISALSLWIYFVITTETILLRNDVAMESNTWSFGQTVAIVLVLLPIIDLLSLVKSFYLLFFFPALIFIVYSQEYQICANGYLFVDHP